MAEAINKPGQLKRRLRAGSDSTFVTKKQMRESMSQFVEEHRQLKNKRARGPLLDRSNNQHQTTNITQLGAPLVARYQGAPGAFNKRGSYLHAINPVERDLVDMELAMRAEKVNRKRLLSKKSENSPVPFKKPALQPHKLPALKRQPGVSSHGASAAHQLKFRRHSLAVGVDAESRRRSLLRPSSVNVFMDEEIVMEEEVIVDDDQVFSTAVRTLPEIKEIDLLINLSDPLFQKDYCQDCLDYMRIREVALMPMGEVVNAGIKILARVKVVDWMIQVQHFLKLQPNTLYIAVNILDRYIRVQHVQLSRVQLLSITSLLIASKLNERYPCEIEKLIYLTENSYVFRDVVELEEDILVKLDFCVTCADPDFFMERFLSVGLRKMILNQSDFLLCLTRFYLDCNLPYEIWTTTVPSKLAAGATCLVSKVTSRFDWDEPLKCVSRYSELDLALTMQEMAVHIVRSNQTEFRGAFNKHSSSSYKKLASDLTLSSESKILQAIAGLIPEGLSDNGSFTLAEE